MIKQLLNLIQKRKHVDQLVKDLMSCELDRIDWQAKYNVAIVDLTKMKVDLQRYESSLGRCKEMIETVTNALRDKAGETETVRDAAVFLSVLEGLTEPYAPSKTYPLMNNEEIVRRSQEVLKRENERAIREAETLRAEQKSREKSEKKKATHKRPNSSKKQVNKRSPKN